MKIHIHKNERSGLSRVSVEEGSRGRFLLDGRTGDAWQGHTTELTTVVRALQGWDTMPLVGDLPYQRDTRDWINKSYREF